MPTTKQQTNVSRAVFGAWPKSHTAQQAMKHLLQTEALCHMIGITIDQWRMLLFEAGCRWAEAKHADNPEWAAIQLQSAEWGYWAVWMQDWLENDAKLLQKAFMTSAEDYCALKEEHLKKTDIIW